MKTAVFTIFCVIAVSASPAAVHRWVDKDGNVHFGDEPPADVVTEEIHVEAPKPDPTDIGEIRRRRLLEEAERDAARRAETREEARAEEAAAQRARSLNEGRCFGARVQLAVLNQKLPVYRTSDGRYRPKWAGDTYTGAREYLDNGARRTAIGALTGVIHEFCADPDDPAEQFRASWHMQSTEHCLAKRVELEAAERPKARTSDQELRELRQYLKERCR